MEAEGFKAVSQKEAQRKVFKVCLDIEEVVM